MAGDQQESPERRGRTGYKLALIEGKLAALGQVASKDLMNPGIVEGKTGAGRDDGQCQVNPACN